ncbi:glutathione S-transferase T3-like protein [Tanacetum coccineum]
MAKSGREVAERFYEEMGEDKRSYDSVNCKWKNRIRPKVSQFCEIYNSVRDRHQSGSCDNTVYQEAELEYRTIYNAPFTLTECWKILKDHPKWKKVEMTKFYKSKQSSSKKSRTSENTSQGNSDSTHIGMNLNDEAADSEDVEAQEVPAPISGLRRKDHHLVLVRKLQLQRKESSSEYLRIKERELELEERKRQEQGELERMRIAQREKELDLQQKMFEFQQQQKFKEDLKYYNEDHDHLTGRALSMALFLKKKIKERWNLDY